MGVPEYYEAKEKAKQLQLSTQFYFEKAASAAMATTIGEDGLVNPNVLKDEAARETLINTFINEGVKGAAILLEEGNAAGIKVDTQKLSVFQKARLFHSAYNIELDEVDNFVERAKERITETDEFKRNFYQNIETVKNRLYSAPKEEIDFKDKDQHLSYIRENGATTSGVVINPAKVEKKRDLLSILDEFDKYGVLTPKYKERQIDRDQDFFL